MILKRKINIIVFIFLFSFSLLSAQNKDNYFDNYSIRYFDKLDDISTDTLPSAPVLRYPPDNASLPPDTLTVNFKWNMAVPYVTHYRFELATDSSFNASYNDSTIPGTFTQVTNLLGNKQYWWRVQAYNSVGWGPFSLVRTFTTKSTNYINDINQISHYWELSPNPSNDYINLSFQLNDNFINDYSSHLRIINVLGCEFSVNYVQNGSNPYLYHLDTKFLPNGSYFVIVQTENQSFTIPFIVIH